MFRSSATHVLHSLTRLRRPTLPSRCKCSISNNIRSTGGTGGFDFTFLGTSSQGGARRYPSSLALRLRGAASSQVWLFDAGEGATAQLQRSNMRIGLVRNIFITHLHGDHLYGLPGLVMCILGRRDELLRKSSTQRDPMDALHIYGPPGVRAFLRMALGVSCSRIPFGVSLHIHEMVWPSMLGPSTVRSRHRATRPYWRCPVRALPFEGIGRDIEAIVSESGQHTYQLVSEIAGVGASAIDTDTQSESTDENIIPATVVAAPVFHTVPTFAFRVTEVVPPRRFDKDKLGQLGIPSDGRDEVRELFEGWLHSGRGIWQGREIEVNEVLQTARRPRSICIVGDTFDAQAASHIAHEADVLIHEATNMAAQTHMARSRGHSSTLVATNFAKRVRAKRLVLNHTSVAYSERKIRALELEARGMLGFDRAFVARDLSVFNVPTEEEDNKNFVFRQFVGFADSLEYRSAATHPFGAQLNIEEEEDDDDEDGEGGEWARDEDSGSNIEDDNDDDDDADGAGDLGEGGRNKNSLDQRANAICAANDPAESIQKSQKYAPI